MMLANKLLRVSLVTTHLPISRVSQHLTFARIRTTVEQTADFLQSRLKIKKPKIAVAAFNPHGGESGLFGDEESRVILPTLRSLRKQSRYQISGPWPADTLFAKHSQARRRDKFDAVVCMYHDQGLIPVKLLDFPHTVNVTLGLPMIRTSVDHGVAFDIAGKGVADSRSLESAIDLALQLTLGDMK